MRGVTRDVVMQGEDLEVLRVDVAAGRRAAVAQIQACPTNLRGARAGAEWDREARDRLLAVLGRALRVTITVPEEDAG